MINKSLLWDLEITKKNIKHQCGFHQNHSTQDVLSTLHADITDAIIRKQHLILIVLDLEKTYDMVWRKNVLSTLIKWKITGNMLTFINNFLLNHKIQIKLRNTFSNHFDTENELPQSSYISATLFLIAINDIFNNL